MKPALATAPGRCGIVGNPSDIYGGFVVSCAIPLRATCRLTPSDRDELHDDLTLWKPAVAKIPVSGVRVEWPTQIPRSRGLSGSTAILAATLAALQEATGAPQDWSERGRIEFAELVRDAECNLGGVVGGYQDAYVICNGGLLAMDFAGKHPSVHGGPRATFERLDAPLPFLLVSTDVERLSGSVHGPIRDRWLRGEPEVVDAMARVAELGREGREHLKRGDWRALAHAMTENHTIVAKLGGSGDAIDRLIAQCLEGGAMAAKLAGAGLGGTVIALTEDPDALERHLQAEGYSLFFRPTPDSGVRVEP
ncbi:MAG: hypothetical protein H3C58_12230 [Fimbriimonadaceae bacterium]|nr:hypothetical protein [Fimbriimonadaceae bacterium]